MSKSIKMMWIEDEIPDLSGFLNPFIAEGIEVITTASYIEAIDILNKIKDIDIFLIDLRLPFGDGNEKDLEDKYLGLKLIKHIRNNLNLKTPIFIFSVVYDLNINKELNDLDVEEQLQKGTYSDEEACNKVIKAVRRYRKNTIE